MYLNVNMLILLFYASSSFPLAKRCIYNNLVALNYRLTNQINYSPSIRISNISARCHHNITKYLVCSWSILNMRIIVIGIVHVMLRFEHRLSVDNGNRT